jgi:hypothetical protein
MTKIYALLFVIASRLRRGNPDFFITVSLFLLLYNPICYFHKNRNLSVIVNRQSGAAIKKTHKLIAFHAYAPFFVIARKECND